MAPLLLLIIALVGPANRTRFVAKVVGVADGDNITVLQERQQIRIRLDGIDCPKCGQPFSNRAKQLTLALTFGREVIRA